MPHKFGDLTLTMVNGGDFRLDGGAMHGVVPKTMWNRLVSCDEHNRCTYTTNCLLVETADNRRVLVDTGNGDKLSPKLKDIYGIDHDGSIATALTELGVPAESIDAVIFTHLHFDHCGGATRRAGDAVELSFPRAKYYVQRAELDAALAPHERNRASYLQENIAPLAAADALVCVDGPTEIVPGISVVPTPGHSHGHQSVLIDAGDDKAVFFGDVVPTSVHVRLPFIMAYDLNVEATLQSKKQLYDRALAENWLCMFGHDRHHATRLTRDERGRPIAGELIDLD